MRVSGCEGSLIIRINLSAGDSISKDGHVWAKAYAGHKKTGGRCCAPRLLVVISTYCRSWGPSHPLE